MESRSIDSSEVTISYYDKNVDAYIESTFNADMHSIYEKFEKVIKPGGKILDLGCGSGRDSLHFHNEGFDVVALDPSKEMCAKVKELLDIPVLNAKAEGLIFSDEFDAIWACASLLHVKRENMEDVLRKIAKALKPGGVAYLSWKYGDSDRIDGERQFTDYTDIGIKQLIAMIPEMDIIEIWITGDMMPNRRENRWTNVLVKKKG